MGQGASLLLGSSPSLFEATRQPSEGRPETEGLRRNPLTGTTRCTRCCTLSTAPLPPSSASASPCPPAAAAAAAEVEVAVEAAVEAAGLRRR